MNIYKSLEDGELRLGYKGIDEEEYKLISIDEFIEEAEKTSFWNDIEKEVWEEVLADYGLDYSDYDDPDDMWDDLLKKAER